MILMLNYKNLIKDQNVLESDDSEVIFYVKFKLQLNIMQLFYLGPETSEGSLINLMWIKVRTRELWINMVEINLGPECSGDK